MSDIIEVYPTYIEIDGTKWVIPYDRVYDLTIHDGNLVNITSSSLTLYQDFIEETSNVYPRLVCNVGRVCYVQTGYNTSYYLNDVTSLEREIKPSNYLIDNYNILLVSILLVMVVRWVFTRN